MTYRAYQKNKIWTLWDEMPNIRSFKYQTKEEQDRLIDILLKEKTAKQYIYSNAVSELIGNVDSDIYLNIGINLIKNGVNFTSFWRIDAIITEMSKIDINKTKEALTTNKCKKIAKYILRFNKISIDDEVLGLRALSTSKYIPKSLYQSEYAPRLEAIKKIPPVMRLRLLESLSQPQRLSYNIFKNISEDQLKSLLFTVCLKHTDRVQVLNNKFSELKFLGIKSLVKISGYCNLCKDFSFSIESNVIRTKEGIHANNLSRFLNKSCPFCYESLQSTPMFENMND